MKKDFESRFMPNVKFKIPSVIDGTICSKLVDMGINLDFSYYATDFTGERLFCVPNLFCVNELNTVSYFEAIPGLVPEGMKYNKELDKLIPSDVFFNEKTKTFEANFKYDSLSMANRCAMELDEAYLRKLNFEYSELINKSRIDEDKEKLDSLLNENNGLIIPNAEFIKPLYGCHNCSYEANCLTKKEEDSAGNICLTCDLHTPKAIKGCKNPNSKHYELWNDFESIDAIKKVLTADEYLGFLKGNILKYQLRLGKKDDVSNEKEKIEDYQRELNSILGEKNDN